MQKLTTTKDIGCVHCIRSGRKACCPDCNAKDVHGCGKFSWAGTQGWLNYLNPYQHNACEVCKHD
jgi:hypothetical protein